MRQIEAALCTYYGHTIRLTVNDTAELVSETPARKQAREQNERQAQAVESAALIPLGKKGQIGLLAIGSQESNPFHPGMGTLFLDLLADVISVSLSAREPEAKRRSA